MPTADPHRADLKTLFVEVFQGTPPGASGTWFVQGGEAFDATLAQITAEQASHRAGGASSIAAHVVHTAYYLELANDALRRVERDADWSGSWARQSVDEKEWAAAKSELANQANRFVEVLDGDLNLDGELRTYLTAIVCHTAYHLGAVRQLALIG